MLKVIVSANVRIHCHSSYKFPTYANEILLQKYQQRKEAEADQSHLVLYQLCEELAVVWPETENR